MKLIVFALTISCCVRFYFGNFVNHLSEILFYCYFLYFGHMISQSANTLTTKYSYVIMNRSGLELQIESILYLIYAMVG